jgi:hypothetical protein
VGLGCCPLDDECSHPPSHSDVPVAVFAVCRELVGCDTPASQQRSTPAIAYSSGCTSMHFGENQLSPCSIGISPLPTAHPSLLQQTPVRPFTPCYGRCSLAMGSSHGFRSAPCHPARCSHSLSLCLRLIAALGGDIEQLVGSYSKRHAITPPPGTHEVGGRSGALTAWTRSVSGSVSLPSPGYFSPFPHGTVRYRSGRVACLGPWAAQLPTGFHVSGGTREQCPAPW